MLKALRRHNRLVLFRVSFAFFLCLVMGCVFTDTIVVENIDMTEARDGTYNGEYEIHPVTVVVDVTVRNRRIEEIVILKHEYFLGKPAEAIIDDVIRDQSLQVDVVAGATVSSKCILKAIENALHKGLENGSSASEI